MRAERKVERPRVGGNVPWIVTEVAVLPGHRFHVRFIVDLDARLVERWQSSDERPEILTETLAWSPQPNIAPLTIDLPRFFAEVLN